MPRHVPTSTPVATGPPLGDSRRFTPDDIYTQEPGSLTWAGGCHVVLLPSHVSIRTPRALPAAITPADTYTAGPPHAHGQPASRLASQSSQSPKQVGGLVAVGHVMPCCHPALRAISWHISGLFLLLRGHVRRRGRHGNDRGIVQGKTIRGHPRMLQRLRRSRAYVGVEGQKRLGEVTKLSLIHISEPTRPY